MSEPDSEWIPPAPLAHYVHELVGKAQGLPSFDHAVRVAVTVLKLTPEEEVAVQVGAWLATQLCSDDRDDLPDLGPLSPEVLLVLGIAVAAQARHILAVGVVDTSTDALGAETAQGLALTEAGARVQSVATCLAKARRPVAERVLRRLVAVRQDVDAAVNDPAGHLQVLKARLAAAEVRRAAALKAAGTAGGGPLWGPDQLPDVPDAEAMADALAMARAHPAEHGLAEHVLRASQAVEEGRLAPEVEPMRIPLGKERIRRLATLMAVLVAANAAYWGWRVWSARPVERSVEYYQDYGWVKDVRRTDGAVEVEMFPRFKDIPRSGKIIQVARLVREFNEEGRDYRSMRFTVGGHEVASYQSEGRSAPIEVR